MSVERLDIVVSENGSRTVKRNISSIGEEATKQLSPLRAMREAVVGVAAAFGAREFLNVLREFDLQMGMLRATTNATGAQMGMLRNQALEMGSTTEYSAAQAAHAQVLLARAGLGVNGTFEATPHVLRLAQATAMDIADAGNIAAQSMRGMRLTTADLNHILDVLAYTASNSNTDVQMLGDGMKYAAPLAAGLHIPLEQVAAAAAALSDSGMQSTMFGTGLRQFFAVLESPSKKVRDIFTSLHFTMQQINELRPSGWIANGKTLSSVLIELADHGLDAGTAMEVFGARAGNAAGQLLSVGERIGQFTDQLSNVDGVAEHMAEVVMDNLQGSIWRFFGSIGTLIVRLGDSGLTAVLRAVLTLGQDVFMTLANNINLIIPIVYGLGAAFTLNLITRAGGAIDILLGLVVKLRTALISLWALMLANPLLALAAAVTAIGVALYNFRDNITVTFGHTYVNGVRQAETDTYSLGNVVGLLLEDVGKGSVDAVNFMVNAFATGHERVRAHLGGMKTDTNEATNDMADSFRELGVNVVLMLFEWREQFITFVDVLKRELRGEDMSDSLPFDQLMDIARARGDRAGAEYIRGFLGRLHDRSAASGSAATPPINYRDIPEQPLLDLSHGQTRKGILADESRELRQNTELIQMNTRQREVWQDVYRLNNQLEDAGFPGLSDKEQHDWAQRFANQAEDTRLMQARDRVMQDVTQTASDLIDRQRVLNDLIAQGGPLVGLYRNQMADLNSQMLQLRANDGTGGFVDGFMAGLDTMLKGVHNWKSRAGAVFADFFSNMSDGFANSVGRAVAYSEDLGSALLDVARQGVAAVISALVKMGIQQVLNQTLGQSVAAAANAALIAEGAAVAAAWSPAAAAVSLASFGANAPAAIAGMSSAYGVAAALSIPGLKDGGWIDGPGGSREDRHLRALASGEFVVNSAAAARNAGTLEAMNAGATIGGGIVINAPITVNTTGGNEAQSAEQVGRLFEKQVVAVVQKHTRPGGALRGNR